MSLMGAHDLCMYCTAESFISSALIARPSLIPPTQQRLGRDQRFDTFSQLEPIYTLKRLRCRVVNHASFGIDGTAKVCSPRRRRRQLSNVSNYIAGLSLILRHCQSAPRVIIYTVNRLLSASCDAQSSQKFGECQRCVCVSVYPAGNL